MLAEVASRPGVQTRARLVEQQQLRRMQQPPSELGATRQSSRERLDEIVGPLRQIEIAKHLAHATAKRGSAQAVEMTVMNEIFRHGQLGIEAGILEDHAEPRANALGFPLEIVPEHAHSALAGPNQRREDLEQSGLAAAVGAEQSEDLAALDGEADSPQRFALAVAVSEVGDFDRRGHGGTAMHLTIAACAQDRCRAMHAPPAYRCARHNWFRDPPDTPATSSRRTA